MHIPLQVSMRGFFRLRTINKYSGKVRVDTGFFPNKMLDSGRNEMGTRASWLTHCHVGTSSVVPLATDTGLLGKVAHTSGIEVTTFGAEASSPYFGWKRITYRFPQGAGQGGQNLNEVGVGWGTGVTNLISRALIIDPFSGLPTTITPLADEILDVTYELRYYPPLGNTAQSVTLSGLMYDTISMAAEVTSSAAWAQNIGIKMGENVVGVTDCRAYDGAIGGLTVLPSGLTADLANVSEVFDLGYSNNSYQANIRASVSASSWVLGSGIRCLSIKTMAGTYKTSFTRNPGGQTVPKTISNTAIITWVLGWVEGVI